jgi:carboxylate-amine ligase
MSSPPRPIGITLATFDAAPLIHIKAETGGETTSDTIQSLIGYPLGGGRRAVIHAWVGPFAKCETQLSGNRTSCAVRPIAELRTRFASASLLADNMVARCSNHFVPQTWNPRPGDLAMERPEPSFTLGIEEEYLLVDAETFDLVEAPAELMQKCLNELGKKVSPEFLRCQIEVGTGVCATVAEAREDLAHLRRTVRALCRGYGLEPIAASTHPFADWHRQQFTDKERYRKLEKDLAGVARRMLICGMHVHVGIEDDDLRIDLLGQFSYFLPHLLALSTSSPFWEGLETGLHSYRLTVFDNLPRTGLPPPFTSYSEYERSIQTIINTKIIEDATKIWWDLRPSARFPTLESRICDVSPRLDHAIAIAALTQSLMKMLYALGVENKRWRHYDRFLIEENRWRAQRYGLSEGLIDLGIGKVVPFVELLEALIDLATPHARALGCLDEMTGVRSILEEGTSSQRQVSVFHAAVEGGADENEALKEVVRSLVSEFGRDL